MNFLGDNLRARLEAILPGSQSARESKPSCGSLGLALVLDSDEATSRTWAEMVRSLGYETMVENEPDGARDAVANHPICLAIVEHGAAIDGIALSIELMRDADAQGRKLHVILAASDATKDIAIGAMRAPVADFLEKPLRVPDLRRALQRVSGLDDRPAARDALLGAMTELRAELDRLSRLMVEPGAAEPPPCPRCRITPGGEPVTRVVAADQGGLADYIRKLLKMESKRRRIGTGDVFGDPAWEMLLDLMLAKIEGRRVSISSACIASGAPMSTALRLVGRLVDEGVLRKIPDETDRRRHFLLIDQRFEQPLMEHLSDRLQKFVGSVEP